jgi:hypothetical protein
VAAAALLQLRTERRQSGAGDGWVLNDWDAGASCGGGSRRRRVYRRRGVEVDQRGLLATSSRSKGKPFEKLIVLGMLLHWSNFGKFCLHRACLSIVLQTIACKEEEQKKDKCEIGFDSKECKCLVVLRELAAENMVLHQELDDKKLLVTRLKK